MEATDKRYTITREWCGYAKPRWVVRFCDEYLGNRTRKIDAVRWMRRHQKQREAILTGKASS